MGICLCGGMTTHDKGEVLTSFDTSGLRGLRTGHARALDKSKAEDKCTPERGPNKNEGGVNEHQYGGGFKKKFIFPY